MRALTVAVGTGVGVLVSPGWAPAYILAIGVCVAAFGVALTMALRNPSIASLRHAALGTGALAVIALIVGLLLAFGADLAFEVRVQLRTVILAVATAPAIYWLLWVLDPRGLSVK
jgi:hypothetical protein